MANTGSINIDLTLNVLPFQNNIKAVLAFLQSFKSSAEDIMNLKPGNNQAIDKITNAFKAYETEIKKTEAALKNKTVAEKQSTSAVEQHSSALVTLQDRFQQAGLRVQGFQSILTVLKGTFGNLLKEYESAEIANSKLANGLKNVGESAGAFLKLQSQASNLQKITPFDDADITNAQSMLTTFMKSSQEIEVLTPRILDLAAAFMQSGESGMNLQQVAVMLGKVNEETIGTLRRVGVAFSKEQEEKLKSLKGTQQAIYLSEILDQNFKGMAETVGKTAAGKLKIFQNQIGEMKESMGKVISEGLTPFLKLFQPIIEWIAKAPPFVQALAVGIMALAAAFMVLNTSMGALPYIIGGVITAVVALTVAFGNNTNKIDAMVDAQLKSMSVSKDMQKVLSESGLSANNLSEAYQNLSDSVIYMGKAQLMSARDFLVAQKTRIEGAIAEAKANTILYYSRIQGIESESGKSLNQLGEQQSQQLALFTGMTAELEKINGLMGQIDTKMKVLGTAPDTKSTGSTNNASKQENEKQLNFLEQLREKIAKIKSEIDELNTLLTPDIAANERIQILEQIAIKQKELNELQGIGQFSGFKPKTIDLEKSEELKRIKWSKDADEEITKNRIALMEDEFERRKAEINNTYKLELKRIDDLADASDKQKITLKELAKQEREKGLLILQQKKTYDNMSQTINGVSSLIGAMGAKLGESGRNFVAWMQSALEVVKSIFSTINKAESGGGFEIGDMFSILTSFLGFLAEGGPAKSNQPYIVGERGPELFIPRTAGEVIPNHWLKHIQHYTNWDSQFRASGGSVKAIAQSSQPMVVIPDVRVTGENLDLVFKRFNKSQGVRKK